MPQRGHRRKLSVTIRAALIVEDPPDAGTWLRRAVQTAFPDITVDLEATYAAGLARIDRDPPSIALIDLELPDGSGIGLIERLRSRSTDSVIVVSTVFGDDQHLFAALRAGASGYVLKDESESTLAAMLRGIARGEPPLSPGIARRLLAHFHDPGPTTDAALTPRERDVLTLLAKGLTVAASAEMLGISVNTTAGYAKNIYRKLNVTSRAEATLEATRRGLVNP
jgi:DNA-binding NarL/FixJ family response regulator